MDLSKLSDADLAALEAGDLTGLSDAALASLEGTPEESSGPDTTSMADRFGQGLKDPISGAAQLLTRALPEGVVKAGNKANNWLADKTGLVGRLPEGGVDEQVRTEEKAYQKRRGDQAGKFDAWRTAGNVLNPAVIAPAAAVPSSVASVMGKLGIAAGLGGATAASAPVTEGSKEEFWPTKGKQVAAGAGFGAAAVPVAGALSRVISPHASTNPQLQMLRREGVQPTIGQTLGGSANIMEQKATSLPIVGDMIHRARGRAADQFENAAINRSQRPIGRRVEGSGHDAIAEARANVDEAYASAKAQLGGLVPDQQFTQELTQLRTMAQGLTPPFRRKFERQLNDLLQSRRAPGTGGMTAETFKRIDSDLTTEAASFAKAPAAAAKEYGDSIRQLQSLLTQTARRSNPQAAEAFSAADAAYANLVRIENASNRAVNNSGHFTPGQLNQAVRASDRSIRHNQTSRGGALMQDLSDAGQSVLGNRVPDSGTAGRLMLGGGALASAALHPGIPLSLTAAGAMYTGPMQSLLRGSVASRPQIAQPVAGALSRLSPRLAPATGLAGLDMVDE